MSTPQSDSLEGLVVSFDRTRFRAAAIHLLISATIAGGVLALVYLGWYPAPLDRITGVGEILALLLAVDVTLGPLMTAVVFDRRKRSLRFDMACIALMQLAALAYGIHTVEAGRPHFLVFAVDRFEVVSRAELARGDIEAATGNPEARIALWGPRLVSVAPFDDPQERLQALVESVQGGKDLQHFPIQYRSIESAAQGLKTKSSDISTLRELNPDQHGILERAILRTGLKTNALRFVPIKGPAGDAAMLIDASHGAPALMVDLKPWR